MPLPLAPSSIMSPDDVTSECTHLVSRRRLSVSRRGLACLSSSLLRSVLLHLPLEEVARTAAVCTAVAIVVRTDTMWSPLMRLHWCRQSDDELEQRVADAIRQRRDALSPAVVALRSWPDPHPANTTPDPPTRTSTAVTTPLLVSQRLAESGVPRSRLNIELESLELPPAQLTLLARPSAQRLPLHSPLGTPGCSFMDAVTYTPNGRALDAEEKDDDLALSSPSCAAAARWCAAPNSLKSIFQETLVASHRRFEYLGHVAAANVPPRWLKTVMTISIALATLALATIPFSSSRNKPASSLAYAHTSSLVYTTTTAAMLALVCLNIIRCLALSIAAHTALWRRTDNESASTETTFEAADKAWWRTQVINRWYLIRYQVWHPPTCGVVLLFMTGVGGFIAAWTAVTMMLGSVWPRLGLALLITAPGLVAAGVFQLGRMLFLSRFMHLLLTSLLATTKLVFLVCLLQAHNPLLMYMVDRSLFLAFVYTVCSFAPNLLLVFCELWTSDEYLVSAWSPILLPPIEPREPDDNDNEAANLRDSQVAESPVSAVPPSTAWPIVDRTEHDRAIPTPHTMGRVIFGQWFEEGFARRYPRFCSYLCSRPGLSLLGGAVIHACSLTYWRLLFALFLADPSFTSLPGVTRAFHFASLAQFVFVSTLVATLCIFVTLQNRNWHWWWMVVYVNAASMLFACVHFACWRHGIQRAHTVDTRFDSPEETAASLAALAALDEHFDVHWFYSWPSWIGMFCVVVGSSLVTALVALAQLYRPKNERHIDAGAVVSDADLVVQYADAQSHPPTPPMATPSHHHLYDFDSSASLSSLDTHDEVPASRPPPRIKLSTRTPPSTTKNGFFHSLHQPTSPTILSADAIRAMGAHAAVADNNQHARTREEQRTEAM